jgi:hypothetical protein
VALLRDKASLSRSATPHQSACLKVERRFAALRFHAIARMIFEV